MSQNFADEASPGSGRKNVAHGASRGCAGPSLTPFPSPALAGEGCRRRGEGSNPHGLRHGLRSCAPEGAAEPPSAREASVARTCFVGPRPFFVDRGRAADLQDRSALFLRVALLFCLATALQAQTPASPSADAYVQQFESSYREVRSLRAEFTQNYTLGGRTRIEAGRVTFARGGLMRWDYQRPTEKLFLSDGKQVSLYIPEEHQLTRASMKSSEDFRVPFELLLTRLNLRRVFARVEMADADLDHDPGNHVLRAFPKKDFAEEYTNVLIELGPQFDMRRLLVNYPDHSRMDFHFDHIERNPSLQRSLFQFTPPAGTEIIDEH